MRAPAGERPYLGAAGYYERFRRRLSDGFVATLVSALGLGPRDRVLDLGCGPARVARQLAPHVGEVIAVDPEPDMVEEGRRCAAAEGLGNVHCLVGSADDLSALAVFAPFRAVTIGTAFHWMTPQDDVLRRLDPLVHPVLGAVALVSAERDPQPSSTAVPQPSWTAGLNALVDRYLEDTPRGWHPQGRHDPYEEILARSPFPAVEELTRSYEADEELSLEAALGHLYSISWRLQQLGDRRAAFEAEAQQLKAAPETVRVQRRDWALVGRR